MFKIRKILAIFLCLTVVVELNLTALGVQNDESINSEHSDSKSNLNKMTNKTEKINFENELIDSSIDKIPFKFQSTDFKIESLLLIIWIISMKFFIKKFLTNLVQD